VFMKKIVPLEKNSRNSVIHPVVHDSHLRGVEIIDVNTVELTVQGSGSIVYALKLRGVSHLFVSEFELINIILDITIESVANADMEYLLENLGFTRYNFQKEYLDNIKLEVCEADNYILTLSPSQGASLCAVFKTLECLQVDCSYI
jgi:hypothetical protein